MERMQTDVDSQEEEKPKPARRPMSKLFGNDGRLAAQFDAYESRPQQVEMAEAVIKAIEANENLVVEAGTGVGKSLGYLVPIAEHIRLNPTHEVYDPNNDTSVKMPTRAIIATGTKNLQSQLVNADLPIVKKMFPDIKYEVLYGCENFISPHRLESAMRNLDQLNFSTLGNENEDELRKIAEWADESETGLRSDLSFMPTPAVWSEVNCQSDLCKGVCKKDDECPYKEAKRRCMRANIIIVNHHLVLSDVVAGGYFLPSREILVVDEGHALAENATSFFGLELSNIRITRLFKDAIATVRKGLNGVAGYNEIIEWLEQSQNELELTFDAKAKELLGRRDSVRIKTPPGIDPEIPNRMKNTAKAMLDAIGSEGGTGSTEMAAKVRAMSERLHTLATDVEKWFGQTAEGYVYQIGRVAKRIVAKANPLDVSDDLRKNIFAKKSVICTSATLSVSGKLDYVKKKLGAEDSKEIVLTSPFDYMKQSLVYVANDMPEMKGSQMDGTTTMMFTQRITKLLQASGGRAMILCTSYVQVRALKERLRQENPDLNFIAQGENVQRHEMVNRLKADPKTVLIGVDSFATGVDIPGEALTLVVIIKIPFPNPMDPMVEARCERLGRRWFMEYSVPEAIVKFRQAFGRLIRTGTDWGVVAILDCRMVTKGYGRKFLHSLPQAPISYDLNQVAGFLKKKRGG